MPDTKETLTRELRAALSPVIPAMDNETRRAVAEKVNLFGDLRKRYDAAVELLSTISDEWQEVRDGLIALAPPIEEDNKAFDDINQFCHPVRAVAYQAYVDPDWFMPEAFVGNECTIENAAKNSRRESLNLLIDYFVQAPLRADVGLTALGVKISPALWSALGRHYACQAAKNGTRLETALENAKAIPTAGREYYRAEVLILGLLSIPRPSREDISTVDLYLTHVGKNYLVPEVFERLDSEVAKIRAEVAA